MTLGCVMLLGRSGCVLAQRLRITARYAEVCDCLLAGGDLTPHPSDAHRMEGLAIEQMMCPPADSGRRSDRHRFRFGAYRAPPPRMRVEPLSWPLALLTTFAVTVALLATLRLGRRLT